MAWIKKESDVEVSKELEYENNQIIKTDAYEVTVTEAYLSESKQKGSKSVSLCINAKTENDETVKTFFTIMGKDGETYYTSTHKGKTVKKQHIGLGIVNSLFKIVLDKEIFDIEPSDTNYKIWDKEDKELKDNTGDGFPDLIGKKVGVCVQMIRKISGKDSSEYPEIAHFFDLDSGLFASEEDSNRRKLDRWLHSAKEYKVIEEEAPKSSFGKKPKIAEDDESEKPAQKRWGR